MFRYLSSTESVLLVPVCVAGDPIVLVDKAAIGAADYNENPDNSIISIDWSRHGDRLALSVVTSSDPRYDWRDLKIVNLDYLVSNGSEQVLGYHSVWTVPLDVYFTAASSEHSPQWGPSEPGDVCQRIAFSQSSQQGRKLFLLDINDGRVGDCGINRPLAISAKVPRALDWK